MTSPDCLLTNEERQLIKAIIYMDYGEAEFVRRMIADKQAFERELDDCLQIQTSKAQARKLVDWVEYYKTGHIIHDDIEFLVPKYAWQALKLAICQDVKEVKDDRTEKDK